MIDTHWKSMQHSSLLAACSTSALKPCPCLPHTRKLIQQLKLSDPLCWQIDLASKSFDPRLYRLAGAPCNTREWSRITPPTSSIAACRTRSYRACTASMHPINQRQPWYRRCKLECYFLWFSIQHPAIFIAHQRPSNLIDDDNDVFIA